MRNMLLRPRAIDHHHLSMSASPAVDIRDELIVAQLQGGDRDAGGNGGGVVVGGTLLPHFLEHVLVGGREGKGLGGLTSCL